MKKLQNDMNSLTERKSELERVLQSLKERHKSAGDRLSELKGIVGTPEEPEGIQGEIRELSTDRSFLSEVIEERSKELEDVIARLEPFEEAERIARVKQELIQLARDAEKSYNAYSEIMAKLDSEIMSGILQILKHRGDWGRAAEMFMEKANSINPCFKQQTWKKATNKEDGQADQLLRELSESANIEAVTSDYVLNNHSYPKTSMALGSRMGRDSSLSFASSIRKMKHGLILKKQMEQHYDR